MSTDTTQLSGPDLEVGIALNALEEGAALLGHANGEAVLVVRRGEEVFAVGAVCTHYSGPLAEGLVVGETVRCPWHHGCFSLRTGEALRAPALNPVACWKVERKGDRIRVTEKLERDPLAPAGRVSIPESGKPQTVVIVGAGAAGSAAGEMLRREGYEGTITMLDDDADAPYDRPNLSKDYLAGSAAEEWIPLRPSGFYREHGIDLRHGVRAAAIDTKARRVQLSDGTALPYDRLLLATGSDPVRPPIPGADSARVLYLRSLADSRAIVARAKEGGRAVVIGASFIGLEVAASLRARKMSVDVVAPDQRPLEKVLGPQVGDFVRAVHEKHGVRFHLGESVTSIADDRVVLGGGSVLSADVVVVGAGVRPRLSLAEGAGLRIDRGLAVDWFLETSVPGVFAAGDIARWPDVHSEERIRVEHWVVAQRQGQTAARNMLGRRERFESVPFFWSAHYDVTIAYVGHAERWDRIDVKGDLGAGDASVSYWQRGQLVALATVGRDRESLATEARLEGIGSV